MNENYRRKINIIHTILDDLCATKLARKRAVRGAVGYIKYLKGVKHFSGVQLIEFKSFTDTKFFACFSPSTNYFVKKII